MPIYTTKAKVAGEIPADRPIDPATGADYTAEAWNTKLDALIAERSAEVDDRVGSRYTFAYNSSTQKFPQISDDVPTPAIIDRIVKYLVVYDALGFYGGTYLNAPEGEDSPRVRYLKDAEALLEQINPAVEGKLPKINISLSGAQLNSSFFTSENDRADDQQDEAIFNREDLDDNWP